MKKFLLFGLIVAFVMSFGLVVYADDFVPSVSGKPTPDIITAIDLTTGDVVELIITAMSKIDTVPEDVKSIFNEAYEKLSKADNLAKLVKELKKVAKELGAKEDQLIVSDVFDISEKDFKKSETGRYKISMKKDSAVVGKFAALLHYTDSQWEYVESAKLSDDGETIEFEAEGLSPFAIVVVGEAQTESPAPIVIALWVALGVLAASAIAVAAVFFVKKAKKIA